MEKETREILERPFADADVTKDYDGFAMVKPHLVIRRLSEAFGQDGWQFVLEQIMSDEWSVTQFGKIGIKDESGEWVWKSNCGTMARKFSSGKPSELQFETSKSRKALYKGAVSNCLKRCAMMLGIALGLYGDAEHDEEGDRLSAVMASIQKGEDELTKKLKCMPEELRNDYFGADNGVLEAKTLEELENYLAYLRSLRDADEPTQPDKETPKPDASEKPEGGPDAHFVDGDVVSQAELHAATLQLQTLVIKKLKSSTKDVQKELTGGEVNMDDAGDLDTYYKLLAKNARDLGLIVDEEQEEREMALEEQRRENEPPESGAR